MDSLNIQRTIVYMITSDLYIIAACACVCVNRWQKLWLRSSERHRQLLEARTRLNDIALARYIHVHTQGPCKIRILVCKTVGEEESSYITCIRIGVHV